MDMANNRFHLLINLSRLHDRARIIEFVTESTNEAFNPANLLFIDKNIEIANFTFKGNARNSIFGFISAKQTSNLTEGHKGIIDNSFRILSILPERLGLEAKLQKEKRSTARKANKKPTGQLSALNDQKEAKIGSLNLIEGL